jgi:hypothetical protein
MAILLDLFHLKTLADRNYNDNWDFRIAIANFRKASRKRINQNLDITKTCSIFVELIFNI